MRTPSRALLVPVAVLVGVAGDPACASRLGDHPSSAATTTTMPGSGASTPTEPVVWATLGRLAIKKWRLQNGLEIITAPDSSATSVSYVTTFRVGSRDENAALHETGLAHLFEHLMFTQTRGAAPGAFDREVESVGGASNAATDHDFTLYVDEVPPAALPRVIALEADRMTNLDLLERQVTRERDVVLEERLSEVDDSVDGTLDEMMYGQAFRNHPYRWPVIGRREDILAVTREKATTFYRRHYAPNQAVVSIAGRFDEARAVADIRAAYGHLTPVEKLEAAAVVPEPGPATEIVVRVQKPVPADRFVAGYPAPALGGADRVPYEILAEILAGGPSSRLYRQLVVEQPWASSVQGQVATTRDPGLFAVWIQMTKGHEAREGDAILCKEMARFGAEPVSAAELGAAKNRLETAFWRELGASRARAEALGTFEVTTGDFRVLVDRAQRYASVTAGDLQRVARTYLGAGARSVVIARPSPPTVAP